MFSTPYGEFLHIGGCKMEKVQIANVTLPTRKEAYNQWMERQYKIERIRGTGMCYRMRLAAISASDNRKGKLYV